MVCCVVVPWSVVRCNDRVVLWVPEVLRVVVLYCLSVGPVLWASPGWAAFLAQRPSGQTMVSDELVVGLQGTSELL